MPLADQRPGILIEMESTFLAMTASANGLESEYSNERRRDPAPTPPPPDTANAEVEGFVLWNAETDQIVILTNDTLQPVELSVDLGYTGCETARVSFSASVPAELVLMAGLGSPEGELARGVLAAPPEKRNIIYAVEGDPAACMAWRAELLKKYGANAD